MTSPEEFLFGAGQTAKFEQVGARVSGIVLTDPVTRQMTDYNTNRPKFWDDGSPMEQLIIRLLTQEREDADDDGVRVLYIDTKNKREALRNAAKDAGAKRILVGAFIEMAHTGLGEAQGGGNPPKLYAVRYQQPTQQTLALVEQYRSGGTQPQPQQQWAPPNQPQTQWSQQPAQPQPPWGPPPQPAQGFPQHPAYPQPQPVYDFPRPQQTAGTPAQPPVPAQQAQAPVPPPAPQPAPVSYTPEIIAAIRANNQDPKSIYPDYDGRYDQTPAQR